MKKRNTILVLIVTIICCLAMALVDGVLRPGYAIKSAIKLCMNTFTCKSQTKIYFCHMDSYKISQII